jgi:predicted DNA-binding transcriptional regulator AlpA
MMTSEKVSKIERRAVLREQAREVVEEAMPEGDGEILEGDKLLTLAEVAARYGVTQRRISDDYRAGRFPAPVNIFGKKWREKALRDWEAAGGAPETRGRPRRRK